MSTTDSLSLLSALPSGPSSASCGGCVRKTITCVVSATYLSLNRSLFCSAKILGRSVLKQTVPRPHGYWVQAYLA